MNDYHYHQVQGQECMAPKSAHSCYYSEEGLLVNEDLG